MQEMLAQLRRLDSATVFNAMVLHRGLPNEQYTDHTMRCLLPELGAAVGFAVTAEVTTNDPDSPALDWLDYYGYVEAQEGPLFAVFQDVDSRPGRGACVGDGMARLHQRLGVAGILAGGTVRDVSGIRQVGMPIWAWGSVPGHGAFHVTRFGAPVTVGQLRIRPGDLLLADGDGCVRVPVEHLAEIVRLAQEVRAKEQAIFELYDSPGFSVSLLRERRRQEAGEG